MAKIKHDDLSLKTAFEGVSASSVESIKDKAINDIDGMAMFNLPEYSWIMNQAMKEVGIVDTDLVTGNDYETLSNSNSIFDQYLASSILYDIRKRAQTLLARHSRKQKIKGGVGKRTVISHRMLAPPMDIKDTENMFKNVLELSLDEPVQPDFVPQFPGDVPPNLRKK